MEIGVRGESCEEERKYLVNSPVLGKHCLGMEEFLTHNITKNRDFYIFVVLWRVLGADRLFSYPDMWNIECHKRGNLF